MPRSVATLLGIALAAFSIGFNTVRYPMVWEMVGPAARAGGSAESAIASQSAQPERPATHPPMPPPQKPAKPIEVVSTAATGKAVDSVRPAETKPTVAAGPAAAETVARKPLVPVTPVMLAIAGDKKPGGEAIRRLPPVDRPGPNVIGGAQAWSPGGPIPVYPTTGIE
jgi:hypothetical protein